MFNGFRLYDIAVGERDPGAVCHQGGRQLLREAGLLPRGRHENILQGQGHRARPRGFLPSRQVRRLHQRLQQGRQVGQAGDVQWNV